MDRIFIRDLKLRCLIGTRPVERRNKQSILINVVLECNLAKAGRTDRLEDTVNYKDLQDRIVKLVEASHFFLVEKLAAEVATVCLSDRRVAAVTVTVDKPEALHRAKSPAVEIRRCRKTED